LICRCLGVADLVDAINLADQFGLDVAVRGGGHNVTGGATIEGGAMIDLSLMRDIYVDPKNKTVQVPATIRAMAPITSKSGT